MNIPTAAWVTAFSFLSRVLATPPDRPWLENLVSQDLFREWPLPGKHSMSAKGLTILREFCRTYEPGMYNCLVEDFQQLFVGPDIKAPPWESVWCSKDHLLFGRETLEVRECYRKAGLAAPNQDRAPDDHLSLELDFMARLEALRAEQDDSAERDRLLELERDFFNNHLMQWAPNCLERAIQASETAFYQGVACLGLGTILEFAGNDEFI